MAADTKEGFEVKCYVTTVCTAQLELIIKIPQLAPSNFLSRQHDDALLAGLSLQEGVSTSDKESTWCDGQLRIFHLSNRCCMDRISATEGNMLQDRTRLSFGTEVQGLH